MGRLRVPRGDHREGMLPGLAVAGIPPAATPPPPFGKGGLWGWVLPGGVCFPNLGVVYCCGWQPTPKAPLPMGTGGKRVPSGHNAEGVSDPQVGSETSTDHGSGLYDD